MGVALPGKPRSLYVSSVMALSSNFYGHPSGVNKLHFFNMANNTSSGYFSAQGQGMGPLQPQVRLQGIADPLVSINLVPNLMPGVALTRGIWHRLEFLLVVNTAGQADGQAHMWLDGVKILQRNDIMYLAPGETAFDETTITSIWGGGNTVNVPHDMYTWWDHMYVSIK